jgi:hypothetical protein
MLLARLNTLAASRLWSEIEHAFDRHDNLSVRDETL